MKENKKGRPGILDNPEKAKQLRAIIATYDTNHNPHNKVRIKAIYEYVNQFYNDDFELSHTWWKTIGKTLIEEHERKVRNKILVIRKGKTLDITDVMGSIDRYGGANKEKLRKELAPVDLHIVQLTNEIERLQNKVNNLTEEKEKADNKLQEMKEENRRLKNFAISLFTYGKRSDTEILNLMKTGESKSEVVNISLKTAFSDPMEFIRELEDFVETKDKKDGKKQNVILFQQRQELNNEVAASKEDDEYDY